MDAGLGGGHAGWTELRVHGVAGTPPETMLRAVDVERIAGDADAGFYRSRTTPHGPGAAADAVEAYSWGGLTAGGKERAFWLLLMPFMLVNLAYWMLPAPPVAGGGAKLRQRAVRRAAEAILRLFALSLTVTMVMAFVQVSMDLIGWQCVRAGQSCTGDRSWAGFFTHDPLSTPARRVVVMAVVPLALSVLLWWLGRTTWLRTESIEQPCTGAGIPQPVDPEPDGTDAQSVPLEDRQMWNGMEQVRKLRALHVTATIALIALFVAAPLAGHGRRAEILRWVALAPLATSALLSCAGTQLDRKRQPRTGVAVSGLITILPWLTLALLPVAGVMTWRLDDQSLATPTASLPWLVTTLQWLLLVQLGLLIALVPALVLLHHWRPKPSTSVQPRRDGTVERTRPAWCGMSAEALMIIAWVIAVGFAAGLGIRVADFLGKPATAGGSATSYLVPPSYSWIAAFAAPLALGVLVLGGICWLWMLTVARRDARRQVDASYVLGDNPSERADAIAKTWAYGDASGIGQAFTVVAVALTAVLVIVGGLMAILTDPTWILDHARPMMNIGTFLVGAFVLGLLWVGRQAYRNPRFRRTFGVLWDIGTFWPRAVHPFAPPCYAERAVPDLTTRIRSLSTRSYVLLSCHSQGSVIGLAVIMQLSDEQRAKVALLTYGSPLRRLYSRFFPGYFDTATLLRAGMSLLGPPAHPQAVSEADARAAWPWRNLHRSSDPIGGPIFATYPTIRDDPPQLDDIDVPLLDPKFCKDDGDPSFPKTYGHSNYDADDTYRQTVAKLRELRRPANADIEAGNNPNSPNADEVDRKPWKTKRCLQALLACNPGRRAGRTS